MKGSESKQASLSLRNLFVDFENVSHLGYCTKAVFCCVVLCSVDSDELLVFSSLLHYFNKYSNDAFNILKWPTPCVYDPVNLHQYLIFWTAGLNNGLKIYGTSEQRL